MSNLSTQNVLKELQRSEFTAVEHSIGKFLLSVNKHELISMDISPQMMMGGMSELQALQMRYGYVNEWTSIIVSLFKMKNYKPSRQFLEKILNSKHAFEWIFTASHWKNTDTLINDLGLLTPDRKGRLRLNESQLMLLLSLICLNSAYKLPWVDFIKAQPGITTTAYIALLNQSFPAISKESSDGFNYLLESAKDFPMMEFESPNQIEKFLGSFFHCSYATSKHKYEFKTWLTKLIRFNCQKQWLTDEVKTNLNNVSQQTELNSNKKPRMMVMVEKMISDHAMGRCYSELITDLSSQYELIGLSTTTDIDEASINLFEEMYFINSEFSISDNVALVLSVQPDIVFYPSIGMKLWTICLSQLRLAPKQIMMGGHPTSSYSTEIDDFLLPVYINDYENLQSLHSEKIISLGSSDTNYIGSHVMQSELTSDFIKKYSTFNESNNEIRIGINGIVTKVTYDIINVCQIIEKSTSKKVTFVFYVGVPKNSVAYLAIFHVISKLLKNFYISHYQGYLPYMKSISACHFLLPTLPFGGSNSNIDAMILNRPKLFIKGNEQIYTRSDFFEWERVGLADELGCDSIKELIDKSLLLIEDEAYRESIFSLINKKCTEETIYGGKNFKNNFDNLFAQVFN